MLPVRCFSCNKVLGHLYKTFRHARIRFGTEEAFSRLRIRRDCCRWILTTTIDMSEQILDFERSNEIHASNDTSGDLIRIHGKRPLSVEEADPLVPAESDPDGSKPLKKRCIYAR